MKRHVGNHNDTEACAGCIVGFALLAVFWLVVALISWAVLSR